MAYNIKGDLAVNRDISGRLNTAMGFDTITKSQIVVTATAEVIDLADGNRDFTVITDNSSTGNIDIGAPTNAPTNGNHIRINLANTDAVDRSFVFDGAYTRPNGDPVGTILIVAGEGRYFDMFYTDSAPVTWTVTADTAYIVPAEVISTVVDASGGAFTETLAAATSTGRIKFWVLSDKTNTATLSVQSGESLNGVVDGAFLFSNYAVGTQFQAVDDGVGNWAVSVIGAFQEEQRPFGRMELTANTVSTTLGVTINSVTVVVGAGVPAVIPFSKISHIEGGMVGDVSGWVDNSSAGQTATGTRMGFTIPANQGGEYRFAISTPNPVDADIAANDAPVYGVAVNGLVKEIFDIQSGSGDVSSYTGYIDVAAGDVVQPIIIIEGGQGEGFNLAAVAGTVTLGAYSNTTDSDVVYGSFELEKREPNDVVLAGMVTPTDLEDLLYDWATEGESSLASSTRTVTLPNGVSWQNIKDDYEYLDVQVETNVHADASKFHVDRIGVSETLEVPMFSNRYMTMAFPADLSLSTFTVTAGNVTINDMELRGIKKQQTVVSPDDVPVVAIAEHKWTANAVTPQATANFSGGTDVTTMVGFVDTVASGNIATFDGTNLVITAGANDVSVEALYLTSGTGALSASLYFRDTADAVGIQYGDGVETQGVSSKGVYGQASDHTPATAIVRAGTTVTLNIININAANSQDLQIGSYVHVKEIVGQYNVINANNVAVNDQATSNYIDIGNVRMQWGNVPIGTDFGDVVFPQPFANTSYSVSGAMSASVNNYSFSVLVSAKTTTQFHYDTTYASASSAGPATEGFDWIAIGVKP